MVGMFSRSEIRPLRVTRLISFCLCKCISLLKTCDKSETVLEGINKQRKDNFLTDVGTEVSTERIFYLLIVFYTSCGEDQR